MMEEKIVYVLVTNPGGVDGLDAGDKGGHETVAYFTRAEAEKYTGAAWSTIHPRVVDVEATRKTAAFKLTAVERLALGIDRMGMPLVKHHVTR